MCGRFAVSDSVNESIEAFVLSTGRKPQEWSADWESRFNIAPTEQIPVLLDSAKTREVRFERAHWSLVPSWSKTLKPGYATHNARAEVLFEKSTWKGPIKSHRAIIPASGFFEWTGEKGAKQPWFIHNPEEPVLGFAGLYSWWLNRALAEDDPNRWTLTATIVTSDAVETLAGIHDRNPVILPEHMWEWWMDPSLVGDQAMVDEAVRAGVAAASELEFYRVAPIKAKDEGPQVIAPIE